MVKKVHYQYLLFIFLLYFFIMKDWLEQSISFVGYGDEIVALFAIPIFMFELKKNQFKLKIKQGGYSIYIILFIIIGLLGSIVYNYQDFWKIAMPDAFLGIKFWIALYVGKHIFSKMLLERYGKKIYVHVRFITFVYFVCFVVDQVFHVFKSTIRYGIRSTQLIYSHPTVFVACCVLLIIILLAIREYNKGWKKWLVILLFLVCTTLRSKAWGIVIAIILICYLVFYRKKKVSLRTILLFIPLLIAIAWDQIVFYFFSSIQSDSARFQLLVKSVEVAKDHFPFGAGFGTFASYYSGVSYSILYDRYGLTGVNGLTMDNTAFMSDSFWPMIIGQMGFIGLFVFMFAVLMLFREIQKLRLFSTSLYAAALSGLSYLLISSMAESAFVHPLAVPIAIMLGYILSQREYKKS